MNYTLHQLQIFLKIVETKSITKAAEDLHLTQPAVSIQLRNFQDQFEIPLTEIIGRQLYITDFGKEIATIAKRINKEIQEISFKTLAYKGYLTGTLKISVVSTGKYIIPYFLSDFLKRHPGIELQLDVTNKSKVIQSLENNEVDFALVSILPESLSVFNEELMQNKLFLVANKDFCIPQKGLQIKDLTKYAIIYREKGSGTRFTMERFFEKHNIIINNTLELTSNEAVKQAVIAGLGLSIMPLIGIKNELQKGDLQIIPLKKLPLMTTWNLIWQSQKSLSPIAKEYLKFIKEEKQKIIHATFNWYEDYS
ncbi:MAG: LysR family transcriptional regulator [Flavobacterium sp.]|uniref:LysR family transcriptional regulator n=1 Tax=unclassified Flavobacterium TaxID=196869 RepID=UPI000C605555|nr:MULTISPECIES: LysR family transcriptional regulator [unclassified Flavobacterium]MBF02861.1 LysR family transcriptional regulator [Flavobacterium sp.]MCO6162809.1 LysR family transcriptional regulator [Flavobacterium sp. NRK F7]